MNKDDLNTRRRVLSVWPEAAKILGIGRNAAYARVKDGTIPSIRLGRNIVVPEDQLERLLQGDRAA